MVQFKKVPARFFATASGIEPVRVWLKGLDLEDRKTVGKDIQKIELGWPIGLPVCRSLGNGIWEVRSDLSSGRTARVLFAPVEGSLVLLHGFIKKTQKTPTPDKELALNRLKAISGNR